MEEHLIRELYKGITTNANMADVILSVCNSYYENPVHNLNDMKMRNTKVKGDIFEHFCQLYLKHCYGLEEVWLLNQVPDDVRTLLNLRKSDFGIDLIARDTQGKYHAIQAKFKKRKINGKTCVTWKQLSTFYALCARTGPFDKHIVMTTADYVRRIGKKNSQDVTIGYNKFMQVTHFKWLEMCGMQAPEVVSEEVEVLSQEDLRLKRLMYYSQADKTL